jgi:hypothetical protein
VKAEMSTAVFRIKSALQNRSSAETRDCMIDLMARMESRR